MPLFQKSVQVEIRPESFSPWQELQAWGGDAAASASFVGRVRASAQTGSQLESLEIEHYPGLCERRLESLAGQLLQKHEALRALVLHRVGCLVPGEVIVLVAVQADRRGPAQRCNADLLEALKHQAPFWKREWSGDQGTWLAANTPL